MHRLDRLTSGILIFAKSAQKSRELELLISGRHVRKEYVCRVNGEFPEGEVVVDQPIFVVSYKIGVCVVEPLEGKQAGWMDIYNGTINFPSLIQCLAFFFTFVLNFKFLDRNGFYERQD